MAALVMGVDSSTQSCKVVIRDADSGQVVRRGSAPHPPGTEVDPEQWWKALNVAIAAAGGLDGVKAVSVGAQQHGLICLDEQGRVIRPAILWNDTRAAAEADQLIADLDVNGCGGRARWAAAVGSVPVASLTISKLRWLADHEPDNARRLRAIALPHDWLTWRLSGSTDISDLTTDRSDASGTGWFDATTGLYRRDLLALALRRSEAQVANITLPRVLAPADAVPARSAGGPILGPGCGDNAGAALALGQAPGDATISIGTSGVAAAVSEKPVVDASGLVTCFADATGCYLPLACTLNGSQVVDRIANLLDVSHEELSTLALQAAPGAGGLVLIPYFQGERTPNLPSARGLMENISLATLTRPNLARATVEGLVCLLADALDAVRLAGTKVTQILLVGGGARSQAVQAIAPTVLDLPIVVPHPEVGVADGAARQAAWVLTGSDKPPPWSLYERRPVQGAVEPDVRAAYRRATAAYSGPHRTSDLAAG